MRCRPPTELPDLMNHTDVLNHFADTRSYHSYLEIGVRDPADNYNRVNCELKTGVDPSPKSDAPGLVKMLSDDFFRSNTRRYDLVFVDGDHHAAAAGRDIQNSLAVLNLGGVVVIHDALPPAETFTRWKDRLANKYAWTGGVWQAVLRHFATSQHHCYILNADWGVAVIDTGEPRHHPPMTALGVGKLAYGKHFKLLLPFRVSPVFFKKKYPRPVLSAKASHGQAACAPNNGVYIKSKALPPDTTKQTTITKKIIIPCI